MQKQQANSGADRETQLAKSTLRLLENKAWGEITLSAVARAARLPLSDALSVVASKTSLPGSILRMLAKDTAHQYGAEAASAGPRERLFDASMTFFDVQERYAVALKKLYRALQFDLPTLAATRSDVLHVAGELLATAEADMGLSPSVQAAVFAAILLRAIWAWRDDDAEMGKTMARLDGDLRRAERFLWPKPAVAAAPGASEARKRGRSRKKS